MRNPYPIDILEFGDDVFAGNDRCLRCGGEIDEEKAPPGSRDTYAVSPYCTSCGWQPGSPVGYSFVVLVPSEIEP